MWRRVVFVCGAYVSAAGCVSSGTWTRYHDVQHELAKLVREPGAAADATTTDLGRRVEPSGCVELAQHVAETFPTLRAGERRARSALARARSEGAPPPPEVMLEVWDFPIGDPQLADREGMYMAGVAQTIPPAGALDGRARAAIEEANEVIAGAADERSAIRARALEACVVWSASALEAERYGEFEATTERMREIVSARVSTGGSIADLARIETELATLRRMRIEAEARARRAEGRLRGWLGERSDDALDAPPALDALPRVDATERWVSRALESRGAIRAARARARRAEANADAAEASATVPTFSVRATFMGMPSARPGLGAAVGMTLPWLWSGEGAARDAARAEVEAANEEVAAIELEVRADVRAAAESLAALTRALDELRERERPAAQRALEAVGAGLATGTADLTAWLDAARALRELAVREAALLREVARAWAELERAVGLPLAERMETEAER